MPTELVGGPWDGHQLALPAGHRPAAVYAPPRNLGVLAFYDGPSPDPSAVYEWQGDRLVFARFFMPGAR